MPSKSKRNRNPQARIYTPGQAVSSLPAESVSSAGVEQAVPSNTAAKPAASPSHNDFYLSKDLSRTAIVTAIIIVLLVIAYFFFR